jgi:predicted DNA-binding protein (MmcQ/YjbR family)
LSRQTTRTVKAALDAKPGATSAQLPSAPGVLLYKVMGKMFAILELRKLEAVIVKCDPALVDVLKQQYTGVGHRSHLDRRFWICVNLDADVPATEIKNLIALSYDLVRTKLTHKQKAELEALS